MSNLLVKREVTFQNLQSLAGQPNNKRVGATVNPKNRKKQYRSKGYTGTFYYASVQNMKVAEQKLLRCTDTHTCPCNVDSDSKAPATAFSDEMPQILYIYIYIYILTAKDKKFAY